jgi:NAD(P)-dependent dehydrogenase (short-subunit alcohol dehydrogenase family)
MFPFGRVCDADDVAGGVLFFASGDASSVTRQRLTVDEGIERDPVRGPER